jgi:hypothetical protein
MRDVINTLIHKVLILVKGRRRLVGSLTRIGNDRRSAAAPNIEPGSQRRHPPMASRAR